LERKVPVLGRPLRHVLELARELLGRDERLLVEHHHGLGHEAPRVGVDLALLARPDLGAVLEHLAGHAHDPAEGLHARDIERDQVPGLDLFGHRAPALLRADQLEAALAGRPEVVERAGQDPGLGSRRAHR
jgi:hypothetical protein